MIDTPLFLRRDKTPTEPVPIPPILSFLESATSALPLAHRRRFRVGVTEAEYQEIRGYCMATKNEFVNIINDVYIFQTEYPSTPIFKLEFPE